MPWNINCGHRIRVFPLPWSAARSCWHHVIHCSVRSRKANIGGRYTSSTEDNKAQAMLRSMAGSSTRAIRRNIQNTSLFPNAIPPAFFQHCQQHAHSAGDQILLLCWGVPYTAGLTSACTSRRLSVACLPWWANGNSAEWFIFSVINNSTRIIAAIRSPSILYNRFHWWSRNDFYGAQNPVRIISIAFKFAAHNPPYVPIFSGPVIYILINMTDNKTGAFRFFWDSVSVAPRILLFCAILPPLHRSYPRSAFGSDRWSAFRAADFWSA